jgi:hypothetical protein
MSKNCKNSSCACAPENPDVKKDHEKKSEEKAAENLVEKKEELDPTHFGDWQINCRAIDF